MPDSNFEWTNRRAAQLQAQGMPPDAALVRANSERLGTWAANQAAPVLTSPGAPDVR